jgi:hypothetical protein
MTVTCIVSSLNKLLCQAKTSDSVEEEVEGEWIKQTIENFRSNIVAGFENHCVRYNLPTMYSYGGNISLHSELCYKMSLLCGSISVKHRN